MEKINHSIQIAASPEKVWDTMLSDETYRKWTAPFDPDSRFEGSWEEGSTIRFLSSTGDGMISRIAENRPYEYLSLEHIGIIENGVEDTTSEKVKEWTPAFENYTLTPKDGGTEVSIEMDIDEEHKKMIEEMWPKALKILKELSEA